MTERTPVSEIGTSKLLFDLKYELQRLAFGAPVDKPRIAALIERINGTSPSAIAADNGVAPEQPYRLNRNGAVPVNRSDDKSKRTFPGFVTVPRQLLAEAYRGLKLNYEMPEVRREIDALLSVAPSTEQALSGETPRRWRVKDEQGDDLIMFWRKFKPASNEVAAADIIEELERELAEAKESAAAANQYCDDLDRKYARSATEEYKALYHELLFAVGNKWPNETRHQTALRYIQQAERGSDTPAQEARK